MAVVIPTARRETRLAFALDALARQTLPRDRFEVVVVRAADSGPKTSAPEGLAVRFLSAGPDSSPAASRNVGWSASTAPLVAFTDDDCRPAADWLERLFEASERERGSFFLQGRTEPDPDEMHRLHGFARSLSIRAPSDWYETCNMAYPRELLERLDGFDERFEAGGDDTDFGLRALAQGARCVYVDAACVWHAVHSQHVWEAARAQARWHSVPLVIAKHPEQRRALEAGVFLRPSHSRVLLAAAGVLASKRFGPFALLAAAPYLRHYAPIYDSTPRGLARLLLELPGRAVVDLAGVVATTRAAQRHGSAVI